LSPGSKFPDLARQIGQRHVDGTRQMTRPRDEFLGLAHIDEDNDLAGREAALQFDDVDPCRRIHAWPAEQTGQEYFRGELLSENQPDAT
jgi:hypothetical protein